MKKKKETCTKSVKINCPLCGKQCNCIMVTQQLQVGTMSFQCLKCSANMRFNNNELITWARLEKK